MKEFQRSERLGAELQRELAEVLRDEVKDPRVGMVTIQEVRVSRDLSYAKVFFTCMSDDAKATQQLLNRSLAGFLRYELARRVRLRVMPQLNFIYDESIARGEHLATLIEQAVSQDRHSHRESES
jgi:ribosome-binding factor A